MAGCKISTGCYREYLVGQMAKRACTAFAARAREGLKMEKDDLWLPTLKTSTPQEGIELAVKLSDLGFMVSQRSEASRPSLRTTRQYTCSQLIATAHVIALNFQTVAAANDWWRHRNSSNGQ